MKLIYDGDVFIYKVGFTCQTTIRCLENNRTGGIAEFTSAKDRDDYLKKKGFKTHWKSKNWGDTYTETSRIELDEPEKVEVVLRHLLDSTLDQFDYTEAVGYLSSPKSFRNELYPEYKANRAGVPKPHYYDYIKKLMLDIGFKFEWGLEADDTVIIEATSTKDPWIIVGVDKDLKQIPGRFFNPDKEILEVVTEEQALINFYTQALTGDRTDNIPGLKGVGEKGAAKILDGAKGESEFIDRVIEAYKAEGVSLVDLDRNLKLLYLLRSSDDEWSGRLFK